MLPSPHTLSSLSSQGDMASLTPSAANIPLRKVAEGNEFVMAQSPMAGLQEPTLMWQQQPPPASLVQQQRQQQPPLSSAAATSQQQPPPLMRGAVAAAVAGPTAPASSMTPLQRFHSRSKANARASKTSSKASSKAASSKTAASKKAATAASATAKASRVARLVQLPAATRPQIDGFNINPHPPPTPPSPPSPPGVPWQDDESGCWRSGGCDMSEAAAQYEAKQATKQAAQQATKQAMRWSSTKQATQQAQQATPPKQSSIDAVPGSAAEAGQQEQAAPERAAAAFAFAAPATALKLADTVDKRGRPVARLVAARKEALVKAARQKMARGEPRGHHADWRCRAHEPATCHHPSLACPFTPLYPITPHLRTTPSTPQPLTTPSRRPLRRQRARRRS